MSDFPAISAIYSKISRIIALVSTEISAYYSATSEDAAKYLRNAEHILLESVPSSDIERHLAELITFQIAMNGPRMRIYSAMALNATNAKSLLIYDTSALGILFGVHDELYFKFEDGAYQIHDIRKHAANFQEYCRQAIEFDIANDSPKCITDELVKCITNDSTKRIVVDDLSLVEFGNQETVFSELGSTAQLVTNQEAITIAEKCKFA